MSPYVLGIDGCRSGWLTCSLELETHKLGFRIFQSFAEILTSHEDAKFIGVDIPIGLKDDGGPRMCDVEARALLGAGRGSSVFPAPFRCLLGIETYVEVCRVSRQRFGKALPQQSFAIFPKIAEVDWLMTPELQRRVFEVHPELCFWSFNHRPMVHRKKSREGYAERRLLLNGCGFEIPECPNWRDVAPGELDGASRDDVLDAAVAAYTAYLTKVGKAVRLPRSPIVDMKGLRMEMIY
jgi:predicted RNase H-like nuclease